MIYFRSADPNRSWLSAAETALDTAALIKALDLLSETGEADLMIRSGSIAVRNIADFYRIEPELDSLASGELSVDRSKFDEVVNILTSAGVVTKPVPDSAWDEFVGWRMNYDRAIVGLRDLVGDVESYWDDNKGMTVVSRG